MKKFMDEFNEMLESCKYVRHKFYNLQDKSLRNSLIWESFIEDMKKDVGGLGPYALWLTITPLMTLLVAYISYESSIMPALLSAIMVTILLVIVVLLYYLVFHSILCLVNIKYWDIKKEESKNSE